MRYCMNCGTPAEDGVKFCTNCGTKIEAPQPEPIRVTPEAQPEQPVYAPTTEPAPAKRSHKTLWIVLTVVAVLLVAAVVGLLIWKPWNSCAGGTSAANVEQMLRTAFEKTQDVRSMHLEMTETVDLSMTVSGMGVSQDLKMQVGVSGDQQKDPDRARVVLTMDAMGFHESALMYTETVDGKLNIYMSADDGKTWSASNTTGIDLTALQDTSAQLETWMKHAKDYKKVGTETQNGEKVTVYTCVIGGEFFKDAMSLTGENTMANLGMDAEELFKDLDDIPVTFSINGDGRLVRFVLDMKDAMRTLMQRAMETAMGGAKIKMDFDIKTVTIEIEMSKFNAIDPIEIPEAAKGKQSDSPKKSGEGVVGTWELDHGIGEEGEQAVALLKAFGATMTITFNEDGTGSIDSEVMGESDSESFTYTYENGVLTIDGAEGGNALRIEGDELILEQDGVGMVFIRK